MKAVRRAEIDGVQRFVKTGSAARADAFAAEADGLQALGQAGLRVPEVVSHGVEGDEAFIVLEYLELQSKGDFAALGIMLAAAHRHAGLRLASRQLYRLDAAAERLVRRLGNVLARPEVKAPARACPQEWLRS